MVKIGWAPPTFNIISAISWVAWKWGAALNWDQSPGNLPLQCSFWRLDSNMGPNQHLLILCNITGHSWIHGTSSPSCVWSVSVSRKEENNNMKQRTTIHRFGHLAYILSARTKTRSSCKQLLLHGVNPANFWVIINWKSARRFPGQGLVEDGDSREDSWNREGDFENTKEQRY